jgi:hypothetical protein
MERAVAAEEATRAPHHTRDERAGNRISESTTERRTARGNNGFMRFGARTQIWEWRNQNLPDHIDIAAFFSQLGRKARMLHQYVTGNSPTAGKAALH